MNMSTRISDKELIENIRSGKGLPPYSENCKNEINKDQIKNIFIDFIKNSNGSQDAENEMEYVKNLAYRDGAIGFYKTIIYEMEKIK